MEYLSEQSPRIEQYEAFVLLAELGSFSRVAAEMGVRQGTVSKWIGGLEAHLGQTLVQRSSRARRLTAAGKRCYPHARDLVAAYRASAHPAAQGELLGRLRLSAPTVFGERFIAPWLADFARTHPYVEVDCMLSDRYVSLLDEGFDLAVRLGPTTDTQLRRHALADYTRKLVAAPSYLEAHGKPTRPEALSDHALLAHSEQPIAWHFSRGERVTAVHPRGRLKISHSASTRVLACEGFGIALLADWLVRDDLSAGRLVALLPGYATPPAPCVALTGPQRALGPLSHAAIATLRAHLRACS